MIFIILAVVANTMAMTVRERLSEYATLKALGFGPGFVVALIFGESLCLTLLWGLLGIALSFPVITTSGLDRHHLPGVPAVAGTLWWQLGAVVFVGVLAAILPAIRSARIRIVDGLRHVA